MDRALLGSITKDTSPMVLMITLVMTLLLMLLFNLLHLPISLSHVSVGVYVGGSFAIGFALNTPHLQLVLLSWLFVPLISALTGIMIYIFMARIASHLSLITIDALDRGAVTITVFYVAYALGANNLGLINSLYRPLILDDPVLMMTMVFFVAITSALGTAAFGKRITKRVGEDLIVLSPIGVVTSMFASALLMWAFTQFSIPISMTQAVIGGVVGAGLIKRYAVFNRAVLYEIIGGWVIVTFVGFILSALVIGLFA